MPLIILFALSSVQAQSGGGNDLNWSTIDGGGGTSSGGNFTLSGTIGQPDAGTMTGGDYALSSVTTAERRSKKSGKADITRFQEFHTLIECHG